VQTGAQGTIEVLDAGRPAPVPRDVLVRVRACGICGTDAAFVQMGGMPLGPGGAMRAIPLGHEPAGEVAEAGAEVTGLKAGDRVVVNPQAAPSGIIGCRGALGGMREYLLIENAVVGKSVAVFPATVPFDVAALNEPMAVARHCVNRSGARPRQGCGVQRWPARAWGHDLAQAARRPARGGGDVIPGRLETALAVGADAVIDSSREDVTAR
jgi:(R,R)-butanediol dehydrogenase / meso-butanediol dehydrogenase / diacetyl reductase